MSWNQMDGAPMDGRTLLLTVLHKGKPVVTLGGFDTSWSGRCWAYLDLRVAVGTHPIAWKAVDAPADPALFPSSEATA